MKFSVIDKEGIWVVNRSEYRMPDGDSGVIYEPGVPTKIKDTAWRKEREEIIAEVEDPMGDLPKPVVPEVLVQEPKSKKR